MIRSFELVTNTTTCLTAHIQLVRGLEACLLEACLLDSWLTDSAPAPDRIHRRPRDTYVLNARNPYAPETTTLNFATCALLYQVKTGLLRLLYCT